jgi:hypothetical protein
MLSRRLCHTTPSVRLLLVNVTVERLLSPLAPTSINSSDRSETKLHAAPPRPENLLLQLKLEHNKVKSDKNGRWILIGVAVDESCCSQTVKGSRKDKVQWALSNQHFAVIHLILRLI